MERDSDLLAGLPAPAAEEAEAMPGRGLELRHSGPSSFDRFLPLRDWRRCPRMGGLVPSETGCGSAKTLPVGRGWLKKRIFRQRILDRTHSNANSLLGGWLLGRFPEYSPFPLPSKFDSNRLSDPPGRGLFPIGKARLAGISQRLAVARYALGQAGACCMTQAGDFPGV